MVNLFASFIRKRILSKKGEATFCLGEKIKTSFSEARMGSCVINYEFILFFLLPRLLQLISQQLFPAVLWILPRPLGMAAVTHPTGFFPQWPESSFSRSRSGEEKRAGSGCPGGFLVEIPVC